MFIWVGYKQGPGHWVDSEQCVLVIICGGCFLQSVYLTMSGCCQWRQSSGHCAGIECKGLEPFEVELNVGMGPL